jgi:hypothetical protein
MAAPTNTFLSTSAVGNREDLADAIYMVSPSDTPLLSMAAKTKAENTLHEWQTQDLDPPADNAVADGDDAAAIAVTPTVRLGNRTQISTRTIIVSGTQQAMNPAGRKNELAYQMLLASKKLKTDMEFGLTNNKASATSPRKSRGLPGWIVDNVNTGAGYVAPNYVTNTAGTDGTQRAFTEAMFKDVLQKCYVAGGSPTVIMLGAANRQLFSTFAGNSTRFDKGEDSKVFASIDVYASDFGQIMAKPNRIQRTRDAFILDVDKLAVAYLRPFTQTELAKTGDSEKRMLTVEYTLECRAPKAHGAALDLL